MLYEAYVHQNGAVQVKRVLISGNMPVSNIDVYSPFVAEYLGFEEANSYEEALKVFETKTRK